MAQKEEKRFSIRRASMRGNNGRRSKEITKNRQSYQLLVEHFQFHSWKYNQLL